MRTTSRSIVGSLVATTFLALSLLDATPARASCVSPTECLCRASPADAVLTVTVTAFDDDTITGEVDDVDVAAGKSVTVAVGDTVTMEHDWIGANGLAVGRQVLASVQGDTVHVVILVDSDNHVTCFYQEAYRPTIAEAHAAVKSETCYDDIAGDIPETECNDTILYGPCSLSTPGGAGGGSAGWAWASLGLLGMSAIGALRRRKNR